MSSATIPPLSFRLTFITFSDDKFLTFPIPPIFLLFLISFINIFPLILLHSSFRFILLTYFIPPRFTSPTSFPLLYCSAFSRCLSFYRSFYRSLTNFDTSFHLTLQFSQGFISLQLRSLLFTFQLYPFFPLPLFFIFLLICV